MTAALAHRGPDAGNVSSPSPGVWLGHRRLSILDLDRRSDQPFHRDHLTITFNGEIYNFRELRAELSALSNFTTDSDTEVILEGWRHWGPGVVDRLRGMFAFALHDSNLCKTWLVRDRFGVKPVFYVRSREGVAFASELKAIEAAFRGELSLDRESLGIGLVWCWLPESRCIWSNVSKLLPGQILEIDAARRSTTSFYWRSQSLLEHSAIAIDEKQAVRQVNEVLQASVRAHLVADVPVCAFLSGGLDSSLVVAMAKRAMARLDCFTVRFSDDAKKHEQMVDDAHYAQVVARELDVKLHIIDARPDMAKLLPQIVAALDEPIGDSAAIATYLICDAAREQGVKVLLSGMGADEIFGGYRKHAACLLARQYRSLVPAFGQRLLQSASKYMPVASKSRGLKIARWIRRFTEFASLPEEAAFRRSYSYLDAESLQSLLTYPIVDALTKDCDEHSAYWCTAADSEPVSRMCFVDVNRFMVSLNETYSDRASMAASTEIRVPFIDREVIELAFKLPDRLKVKRGVGKYVLKKVAEEWLPRSVVYRPKASFTLPLRGWLRGQLRDVVDDYVLSSSGLAGRDWFSADALRRIVADNNEGRADNGQLIWQLLTTEQWMRNHGI